MNGYAGCFLVEKVENRFEIDVFRFKVFLGVLIEKRRRLRHETVRNIITENYRKRLTKR